MTTNPGFEDLNKQCERSITKMSDAEALAHIGKLIDDAFDASCERGAKRALYLLDELSKRKLGDSDVSALRMVTTLHRLSPARLVTGQHGLQPLLDQFHVRLRRGDAGLGLLLERM
ncbi:MAG: hypothetical protein KUL87_08735 [Pseudomonas sp.]|nr:hypothetical protein [Pseudomonas sp.]